MDPITIETVLLYLQRLIVSALIAKGIAVTSEKLAEIMNKQECARLFGITGETLEEAFREKDVLKALKIPVSLVMEPDILTKCLFSDETGAYELKDREFESFTPFTEEEVKELKDREFEHLTESNQPTFYLYSAIFHADDTVNLMSYILGLLCSNKLPTTKVPFKVITYNLIPLVKKYNELESVFSEKFYKWLFDEFDKNEEIPTLNASYTIRTFPLNKLNYLNVDVTGTNSLLASYYHTKNRIVSYQLQTAFYTSYEEEHIDLDDYSFAVSTSNLKIEKKDKEFTPQNCAYVIIDAQKKENNLKENILQILITIDLLGNEFVKFTLMINGIIYLFTIKDFVLNEETKMYQYVFSIREGEEIRGNVYQKSDLVVKYSSKGLYRLLGVLLTNAYLGDPDKEDTPKKKCASKYEFIVEPDKEDKEENKIYLVHPIPYDVRPGTAIPQLVMQFAEIHEDGKARNPPDITIIIPFPKLIQEVDYAEPPIKSYRHGSAYAKVTNSSNVSIVVNGETLGEANRVLDICLSLSNLIASETPKDKSGKDKEVIPRTEGYRKKRDIEPKTVIIRHIKYYSKGYKSDCWDWRKTYNTPGYKSNTHS